MNDENGHASSSSSSPPSSPQSSTISRASSASSANSPVASKPSRTVDDFLAEAAKILVEPVQGDNLRQFSVKLKNQFRERLLHEPSCMLPSYNHQLPRGNERGRFLSLDVGGSTLRVALIELGGRPAAGVEDATGLKIVRIQTFKITPDIKQLEGMHFFDWMAGKIIDTLALVEDNNEVYDEAHPLPAGLAWSFPIEQTSLRGGLLQGMGKGFLAADTLLGQDLGDIIQAACLHRGLYVDLATIINDSTAALLSQSYVHAATRFGLILGTGVNMAVHLPVKAVGTPKFGTRPQTWFDEASHVIINTELGMFGHGILPMTRWDDQLNAGHPKPEFQPLEHLISGYYLGEICRLALLEAIQTTGVFGGVLPPNLSEPYSLDTETISRIEADESSSLDNALVIFTKRHPSSVTPTKADIVFLRTLASLISERSASLVSACVYGLWGLKTETEADYLATLKANPSPEIERHVETTRAEIAIARERTVVAFNGSVIEHYPHYRERCQTILNKLLREGSSNEAGCVVDLVPAEESSLCGAAISLACLRA